MSLTAPLSNHSDHVTQSHPYIRIVPATCAGILLGLFCLVTNPCAAEEVLLGDPSLTAGVPGSGPISMSEIET